jgi:TPR repeat protein
LQDGTVAQVQVPIIGAANRERFHGRVSLEVVTPHTTKAQAKTIEACRQVMETGPRMTKSSRKCGVREQPKEAQPQKNAEQARRMRRSLSNSTDMESEHTMKSRASKVNRGFAITTGAAVALLTLTVSPGAEERTNLTLVSAMQSECDQLAGSPFDELRNNSFAPVNIAQIDSKAVDACRVAFEATGNPRFAYQLGRALNNSDQPDQAMGAYNVAAEAAYPAAQVNFGMLMGRLGDEQAEFRLYNEAAQGGSRLAAYNLGVAYRDGLGTQKDVNKALEWFEKAAAQGDDTAAFNIAAIYDEGTLVPADDQTAIAWYDLAAQRGNTDAMINLGLMYESGEGIEANAQKAAEMYAMAAQRGDTFGAYKFMEFQELGVIPAPSQTAEADGMNTLVLKQGDVETPARTTNEI